MLGGCGARRCTTQTKEARPLTSHGACGSLKDGKEALVKRLFKGKKRRERALQQAPSK